MLDFIPLGRSRWKMGYMNFKPGFIGYILMVMLEKPDSASVASAIVTSDIDLLSPGERFFTDGVPPRADTFASKLGRVVT